MCQYTNKCPTTKHRPGTRCPVIVRQDNQKRKLMTATAILFVMIVALVIFYFVNLN